MRVEPDREGFGEVFDRVRLRVPVGEIDDVVAALEAWRVRRPDRVPPDRRTAAIAGPLVQLVGIVDGVPGFVPKDPSALGLAGTFHFEHLTALEPHEAGMRQIERNGEPKHAIRVEELLRQPGVRQSNDVARLQFAMQALDPPRHQGAFHLNGQVAETRGQQGLVVGLLQSQRPSASARRLGRAPALLAALSLTPCQQFGPCTAASCIVVCGAARTLQPRQSFRLVGMPNGNRA